MKRKSLPTLQPMAHCTTWRQGDVPGIHEASFSDGPTLTQIRSAQSVSSRKLVQAKSVSGT